MMPQTKAEIQKKLESAKRYAADLQKELKVCRERTQVLEEAKKTTKQWTIVIGEQIHWRKDFGSAQALASELVKLGLWWVTLKQEDH